MEVGRMTKAEIVANIAREIKVTRSIAAKAFGAVIAAVEEALQKGEKVSIAGFGTFFAVERKARVARNPRTGKDIKIASRKAPRFTAGKGLKDAVNS
jgi:DNA-binding protein HU-beta